MQNQHQTIGTENTNSTLTLSSLPILIRSQGLYIHVCNGVTNIIMQMFNHHTIQEHVPVHVHVHVLSCKPNHIVHSPHSLLSTFHSREGDSRCKRRPRPPQSPRSRNDGGGADVESRDWVEPCRGRSGCTPAKTNLTAS